MPSDAQEGIKFRLDLGEAGEATGTLPLHTLDAVIAYVGGRSIEFSSMLDLDVVDEGKSEIDLSAVSPVGFDKIRAAADKVFPDKTPARRYVDAERLNHALQGHMSLFHRRERSIWFPKAPLPNCGCECSLTMNPDGAFDAAGLVDFFGRFYDANKASLSSVGFGTKVTAVLSQVLDDIYEESR